MSLLCETLTYFNFNDQIFSLQKLLRLSEPILVSKLNMILSAVYSSKYSSVLKFPLHISFMYRSIFGDSAHCASLADQCCTRQHSIRSTHLPLHDLFCGLLQSVPKILNTACRPSWASNFGLVESKHANSCNVNTASHFDLMIFCLLTRPGNLCTMIQRNHPYLPSSV